MVTDLTVSLAFVGYGVVLIILFYKVFMTEKRLREYIKTHQKNGEN